MDVRSWLSNWYYIYELLDFTDRHRSWTQVYRTNTDHIRSVGSADCVGIGTDFDGFTDPPDELVDMSELPRLTKYLKSLQYPDDVIKKFLGLNALRILQNGWKK